MRASTYLAKFSRRLHETEENWTHPVIEFSFPRFCPERPMEFEKMIPRILTFTVFWPIGFLSFNFLVEKKITTKFSNLLSWSQDC